MHNDMLFVVIVVIFFIPIALINGEREDGVSNIIPNKVYTSCFSGFSRLGWHL